MVQIKGVQVEFVLGRYLEAQLKAIEEAEAREKGLNRGRLQSELQSM
jgi:hypothetical protein